MPFIPPKIDEYLSEGVLEKRLQLIKEKEGDNNKEYSNVFNRCANCQVSIWVGRDKIGWPEHCNMWYHFEDEYEHLPPTKNGGLHWPVCHSCTGKCKCTDSTYRAAQVFCRMCEEHKCTKHERMYDDHMCLDCHKAFKMGKTIVEVLLESRPKTLEELYTLLNLTE